MEALLHGGSPPHHGHVLLQPALQGVLRHGGRMMQHIPNKGHLQPTHMMIAAYHNKNVVWAYKGWFNWNIDHDWTGGVLVEPVQVVDRCTRTDHSLGKPPAPSAHPGNRRLLGIAFDKSTPYKYLGNCDTIHGQFTNPGECRFHDCAWNTKNSPSTIVNNQMTVVRYIR